MPSQNTTPYVGLNQWQGNEYPKREDFVEDNLKIETRIKENADAIESHLADYIQQLGVTELQTVDKTLKGAINEVFQVGNNVKSNTVDALLSVDDSLPITSESEWNNIITQIGNISTGKKWASGIASAPFSNMNFINARGVTISAPSITVSGVDFLPSLIYVFATDGGQAMTVVNTSNPHMAKIDFVIARGNASPVYNAIQLTGNAYVNETGFRLPCESYATNTWIAIE